MTELSINLALAKKLGVQQALLIAYLLELQGESESFAVTARDVKAILPISQRPFRKLVAQFREAGLLTVTRDKNKAISFTVETAAIDDLINPKGGGGGGGVGVFK